jgi:hypothetical protein
VVVATHNEASVCRAVNVMQQLELPAAHPQVHFAQILGMADHLTYALGTAAAPYNATKLLVYGQYGEVLPWLLRRLQENQDVLGSAKRERKLLWAELARRMTPY